jgi:ribosome maturation factor RimP
MDLSLTMQLMATSDNRNPANPKRDALADRLTAFFAPRVAELGLELLQLRLLGARGAMRLDVRVDRQPGQGAVRLNDCRRVSRLLSTQLDAFELEGNRELTIDSAYELEVSSPGMDRVLRHAADFQRFLGMTAKVVTRKDGTQESVVGVLESCADGQLALNVGKKKPTKIVAIGDIVQANLAPTFAEWLALGEKLKAESALLGESESIDAIDLEAEEIEDEPEDETVD